MNEKREFLSVRNFNWNLVAALSIIQTDYLDFTWAVA